MGGNIELKELALQYMENGKQAVAKNEFDYAISMFSDAIHLFRRIGEDKLFGSCLNLLGITYENTGNDIMAVDSYLEGLDLSRAKKFCLMTSMFYNNIGSRYQKLNAHKKAIAYFRKAKTELKKVENKDPKYYRQKALAYLNCTLSYDKLEMYVQAKESLIRAEEIIHQQEIAEFNHIVRFLKCEISWKMGEEEYARNNLLNMLSYIVKTEILTNYVQSIQEVSGLLKAMEEFELWRNLLLENDKRIGNSKTLYFRLIGFELWMEYYQTIQDETSYQACCLEYVKAIEKQKKSNDNQRVLALDINISLKEMETQHKITEEIAKMDVLTRLRNRYSLELDSQKIINKASRRGEKIIVGIVDIDYFKQVNDTYGHVEGDKCLRQSAEIIKKCIHGHGTVYRYGGDEFVILISDGDVETAYRVANRIKTKINENKNKGEHHTITNHFTVSQGYSCFRPSRNEHLADILARADIALYRAKKSGRNSYHVMIENDMRSSEVK